ncbi:Hypothetical protein BN2458_PEG0446 [Helicobacter typhlonius]|uniref:Uncharacterized protein n=1 Tax=Helicobacter typhlonius TaxID=76936 RepID=A0A0S4PV60_9HELI|nr:Hypothetical protein BN2458_PEG0446 [Helicobacter typhlonius]
MLSFLCANGLWLLQYFNRVFAWILKSCLVIVNPFFRYNDT